MKTIMAKNTRTFLGLLFVTLAMYLSSCASVPEDLMVSTVGKEEILVVQETAHILAYLDGTHLQGNPDGAAARKLLNLLEKSLADVNLTSATRAQLVAFQGRVNLILGDKKAAIALYQEAQRLHKGDLQAEILGMRLGLRENIDNLAVPRNQQALVTLEEAIQNYNRENYLEAVALFDQAFISLDKEYRQAYDQLRENAWRLRNISGTTDKDYRDLLKQDSITLEQMLSLIQDQGDLLYKYIGPKKIDSNKVLNQLKTQGLFYSINSWTNVDTLKNNTIVTRSLAARFLWNLYNDRRGTMGNPPKYSHQFASMGSPIQDVPLHSPDFDAILGCVEKEFMELPDGMNFYPENPMSGIDFSESIKKIR